MERTGLTEALQFGAQAEASWGGCTIPLLPPESLQLPLADVLRVTEFDKVKIRVPSHVVSRLRDVETQAKAVASEYPNLATAPFLSAIEDDVLSLKVQGSSVAYTQGGQYLCKGQEVLGLLRAGTYGRVRLLVTILGIWASDHKFGVQYAVKQLKVYEGETAEFESDDEL